MLITHFKLWFFEAVNDPKPSVSVRGEKKILRSWGLLVTNIGNATFLNLNRNEFNKKRHRGFPGGAVVKSLPANAGDTGSSPGLGGSHMPRSGWAREPQLLSLRVWSLCPATGGAAMVKGPRTAMKSGPRTAMKSGPHLP